MKTKMKTKIKISALVILISFFCLSFSVKAASPANIADGQIKQLPEDTKTAGEAVLVATVNIYDAKIVEQKENNFKISFDLSNREKIQPDVRYAVQLIKQDGERQTVVDEKVYPETINLNENQTIKKEIEYIAPDYLKGEYKLWIIAKNQNGFLLSMNPVGNITLAGTKEYLDIFNCNLKVEGDDRQYTQNQGVDIKPEEKLIATCDIQSNFQQEQNFIPTFETYFRTTFGKIVKDSGGEKQPNGSIGSREKKSVNFILPKANEPQAYDVILELKNQNNQSISNKVNFHYVLVGTSATIQNLTLDKDYYQKNEIAKASFLWSGSAANFPQSRLNQLEQLKLFLNIEIENCSDIKKQELSSQENLVNLNIPIIKECIDPKIVVGILDENSKVLDSKIFSIKSQNVPQEKSIKATQTKIITYGVVFVIVLLIISLILILLKRKRSGTVAIFFLVIFSSLTMSVGESKADSFIGNLPADQCSAGASRGTVTFTMTLDKASYAPGDTITLSSSVSFPNCGNAVASVSMASGNSVGPWTLLTGSAINGGQTLYSTKYFTAEATPGNYKFSTHGALGGYLLNCDKSNPDYETPVNATFTNGNPIIYAGPAYVVNALPIGWHDTTSCSNNVLRITGWAYDPNEPSKSIDVHFYNGSTGIGSCTANKASSDVNAYLSITGSHRFDCNVSVSSGTYNVSVYAIDSQGGHNPTIGGTPKSASCVADAAPTPTCTGTAPASATLCSGDDTGLSSSTAISLVSSCSTTKCEYYCNSGYSKSGSVCVADTTPSCICNNASSYCSGTPFPDSCGTANACTGTKLPSYACGEPSCTGKCGPVSKTCLSSCGFDCSTVNCGVYNCPSCPSGNWREVNP